MVEDEAGSVSSDVGQLHRWPPPAMQDVVRVVYAAWDAPRVLQRGTRQNILPRVLTRVEGECTILVGKSLGGASQ